MVVAIEVGLVDAGQPPRVVHSRREGEEQRGPESHRSFKAETGEQEQRESDFKEWPEAATRPAEVEDSGSESSTTAPGTWGPAREEPWRGQCRDRVSQEWVNGAMRRVIGKGDEEKMTGIEERFPMSTLGQCPLGEDVEGGLGRVPERRGIGERREYAANDRRTDGLSRLLKEEEWVGKRPAQAALIAIGSFGLTVRAELESCPVEIE